MTFAPDPDRCSQCHGDLTSGAILVIDERRTDDPIRERRFCTWACVREHAIRRLRTGFD